MSPIASSTAAGTISRRVAGSPLARKAGAVTSERREQGDGREAGQRDGVVVQRERGEHEAGRCQQRPAAAARQRRRQGDEPGADDRARGAVLDGEHLDASEGRDGERERGSARRSTGGRSHASGPSRSSGARSAVCVLMTRSSLRAVRRSRPRPDAPSGRAASTDRRMAPSPAPRFRAARASAHTYGAGELEAALQSSPRLAWRTSCSETACSTSAHAEQRPPRAASAVRRRVRVAGSSAQGGEAEHEREDSRRRPTQRGAILVPGLAQRAARGRGPARAASAARRSGRARPRGRRGSRSPRRSSRRASPRLHVRGSARGDPRSSAARRPAGATRAPRRGRRR